jgi:hypothetical protein
MMIQSCRRCRNNGAHGLVVVTAPKTISILLIVVASIIGSSVAVVEGWTPSPFSTIAAAAGKFQIVTNVLAEPAAGKQPQVQPQQQQQQHDPLRNANMKSKESIRNNYNNNNIINKTAMVPSASLSTTSSKLFPSTILDSVKTVVTSNPVKAAVAVWGGTIITYILNNLSPIPMAQVQACSITGLLAALVVPEQYALCALCGSYAGMAKVLVIPTFQEAILLGIVCASVLQFFNKYKILVGVGGRLGFTAQLACTVQFIGTKLLQSKPFLTLSSVSSASTAASVGAGAGTTAAATTAAAALIGPFPPITKVFLSKLPLVCLYTVLGALFMSLWRESMDGLIVRHTTQKRLSSSTSTTTTTIVPSNAPSMDHHDVAIQLYKRLSTPVAAVSATGLVACMLSPSLSGPAFCGGVIAMSSSTRLRTYGDLIGASIMGGFFQWGTVHLLLGGWGGRLGTFGLFGVMSYRTLVRTWRMTAIAVWKRRKTTATSASSTSTATATQIIPSSLVTASIKAA